MTNLPALLYECRSDYELFNQAILGRDKADDQGRRGYWAKQRDICRSVETSPITLVHTGNAVGKSFADAGIILAFLLTHPNCLVVATAPSQVQLEEVLWKLLSATAMTGKWVRRLCCQPGRLELHL